MKFNLKRPCKECPFRTDVRPYLTQFRAREIVGSLVTSSFPCHKTVDYDKEDHPSMVRNSSHCAGALIMLEHDERPSQMMQIAERLGLYNAKELDMESPVFVDPTDFVLAQEKL